MGMIFFPLISLIRVFLASLELILLMFGDYSTGATYCLCKDGGSDVAYQRTIDYACGNGADCRPILQNGPCFQPNTVKAHCDYAANSYFQNKGQTSDSCNFAGAAAPSPNPPTSKYCFFLNPPWISSRSLTPFFDTPYSSIHLTFNIE